MTRARPFIASALLAAGCQGPHSVLSPAGPAARSIEGLWWVLFWGTIVAAALTIVLIVFVVLRRRRVPGPGTVDARREDRWLLVTGVAIPAAIVLTLLVATFRTAEQVARPPTEPALTIDVVGHQFWWEVRYPDHGVVTANEIHIPVGRPVRLRLGSADVIHSFWVPRLAGKMDMTPGHVTELWLEADSPGVYRGQCAELCGVQHALMAFLVVAQPDAELAAWLEAQARPAAAPVTDASARGLTVYRQFDCVACHAVRGLTRPQQARAPGPDLTHLSSRRTLAAVTLPMSRGNLAGWILDPQAHKPGNRMPATTLTPDQLHDLLAFLEGLR